MFVDGYIFMTVCEKMEFGLKAKICFTSLPIVF